MSYGLSARGLQRTFSLAEADPDGSRRDPLLRIDRCLGPSRRTTLVEDVRRGLAAPQKHVPCKYFYDERGARLFDAICDLPEYYLTRAERALLEAHAEEIADVTRPTHLIELGSGASRKTRVLLDALLKRQPALTYVPFDVSEAMLRWSAASLRQSYPTMRVHGIVGDYDRHLDHLPSGARRLVIFLGSTIGNFTPAESDRLLRRLARHLTPGDFLLMGLDLVKPIGILHAAYNDAAGLTAEFNRNILHVVNRELGGNLAVDRFAHHAFFNAEASQIEMHLRSLETHRARIAGAGLTVSFAAGETIHTEISRKFTYAEAARTLAAAGWRLTRWLTPADGAFALALARVMGAP